MKKYTLDVAACGSDFIDTTTNNITMKRVLSQNLILEGNDFAEYFPRYHCFMRTVWGKLYKGSTLRNTIQYPKEEDIKYPRWYGGDTYNTMKCFNDAKRAGIYNKSLHHYYVYPKSCSYQFRSARIKSAQLLFEAVLEYLKPYGVITPANLDFAYAVYLNDIIDTVQLLFNSTLALEESVNALYEIFLSDYTKLLIAHENLGMYIKSESSEKNKNAIIYKTLEFLLNHKNIAKEIFPKYCELGVFLSAAVQRADLWIGFNKRYIAYLLENNILEEASIKIKEFLELLPDDKEIQSFAQKLGEIQKL